jgi:hypothetical protein
MKIILNFLLLAVALFYISCSGAKVSDEINISYDSFPRKITFPIPDTSEKNIYNLNIIGIEKPVTKENGKTYNGFLTTNKKFYEEKMKPLLIQHLDELKKMSYTQLINTLALFGHEIFRTYYGKDFYRWGGDILDVEDPQVKNHRYNYRFGLDCSGFSTMPYEIAVNLGLLDPDSESALFCSKGFAIYCSKNNIKDQGGLDNTSNNFRVDTRDMENIGRTVFQIEKGGSPTPEQINMLQPGDLVHKSGHVGIIVEINGKPYFLESGGTVLPRNDGLPCAAGESIKIFAKRSPTTIKRCLPDVKK